LDYIVKPVDEERLVRTIQHITKSAVFRSDCFDKDFHIVNNGLKTGYTFIGWNTKADGTGTDYVKDDILTFTEDVTLYALWSEDRIVTGTETDGVTSAPITLDDASAIGNVISDLGNIEITAPGSVFNDIIGDDVNSSLRLSQNGTNEDTLNEVIEKIGDENAVVVSFELSLEKIFSDGTVEKIHNFTGNLKVTVTLTAEQIAQISSITNPKLYWYNPVTDSLTDMNAEFDLESGTATFYTDHFSTFVISDAVKEADDKIPQTGDNMPYAALLGAFISALAALTLLYPKKKSRMS
ncbi:MAG: InlB B-repeat-containing protein, partial [Eubacteriales bacterium]|nr:InlB B-repeat-containing protein [Eubacteriales bacterium]